MRAFPVVILGPPTGVAELQMTITRLEQTNTELKRTLEDCQGELDAAGREPGPDPRPESARIARPRPARANPGTVPRILSAAWSVPGFPGWPDGSGQDVGRVLHLVAEGGEVALGIEGRCAAGPAAVMAWR